MNSGEPNISKWVASATKIPIWAYTSSKTQTDTGLKSFAIPNFLHVPKGAYIAFGNRTSMSVKVKKDSDDNSESFFVFYLFLKRRTLPSAIVLRYILKVKKDSEYF